EWGVGCGVEGGGDVVVVLEAVAARGGEWHRGSNRSGGEGGDEWRLVARWRRGGEVRLEMMTMKGWWRSGRSEWSGGEWWCVASVVVHRRWPKVAGAAPKFMIEGSVCLYKMKP
nr:hypothetical protein [Tanacetum cinerariifolium]